MGAWHVSHSNAYICHDYRYTDIDVSVNSKVPTRLCNMEKTSYMYILESIVLIAVFQLHWLTLGRDCGDHAGYNWNNIF